MKTRITLTSLMLGFLPVTLVWLLLYGIIFISYGATTASELLLRVDILLPCFIFAVWRTWVSHKKLTKIIGDAEKSFLDMLERYYKKNG